MLDPSLLFCLVVTTETTPLLPFGQRSADDLGAHARLVQHVRLDHGLQHPSQGSMPRLNVRNVHSHPLRHLLKDDLRLSVAEPRKLVLGDVGSAEIIEHALFRLPSLHEHLGRVGVLEKQKQFRWKLLVVQE